MSLPLLFMPIPHFSTGADIYYFYDNGNVIQFHYNCSTTELLLGVSDQLYEVGCYPEYPSNQTFFAPKTQDAATVLCVTTTTKPNLFSGLI